MPWAVSPCRGIPYAEGEWVLHQLGWREWALSDGSALRRVDPAAAPISTALGVLGMPGFTAWYGLFVLGGRRRGRRSWCPARPARSGARRGRCAIAGCRVIGSAGSQEKVAWLDELGFDEHVQLSRANATRGARGVAPEGIDIYFDNVGGDHLEAAIGALRTHGRVVACGSISQYNETEAAPGPGTCYMVVTKRLRIQGYIVSDHFDKFPAFPREAARGCATVGSGTGRPSSTARARARAFLGLLSGENIGKMLVKIGPGGVTSLRISATGAEGEAVLPHRALPALRALRRARTIADTESGSS